jgi:thioester reductase-like protein
MAEKLIVRARRDIPNIAIYRLGLLTGDTAHGVMKERDLFRAVLKWTMRTKLLPRVPHLAVDVTPVGMNN